jgi:hypothetical protein
MIRKFFRQYIAFTLVAFLFSILPVFFLIDDKVLHKGILFNFFFFCFLVMVSTLIFFKAFNKRPKAMYLYMLLSMVLKMLIAVIVFFLVFPVFKEHLIEFVLSFFLSYLIFTIFEVIFLLRITKKHV